MEKTVREKYIDFLWKLRDQACAYTSATNPEKSFGRKYCDCKYGYDPKMSKGSEQTGCPELRSLIRFFENMTDEEFEIICQRF